MKEGITGRFGPQLLTDCRLTGADKVVHCTDDRTLVLIFSPIFLSGAWSIFLWAGASQNFGPVIHGPLIPE